MSIAALRPSELFEFLLECLYVRIVEADKHADSPHTIRRLSVQRPCSHGAQKGNEIASPHGCPQIEGNILPHDCATAPLRHDFPAGNVAAAAADVP
jgi:hypothetical protein